MYSLRLGEVGLVVTSAAVATGAHVACMPARHFMRRLASEAARW
jgi:hypothetical protein